MRLSNSAVMELQRAHGAGEHRQDEAAAEELGTEIHLAVFTDGIHVQRDLLPALIVADGAHAETLGAGTGDGVFAGKTVADGAGLAVGTAALAGSGKDFLLSHRVSSRKFDFPLLL